MVNMFLQMYTHYVLLNPYLKLPPKEMAETEELESFAQLNVATQRVDDQSIGIIQHCQHCPDEGV